MILSQKDIAAAIPISPAMGRRWIIQQLFPLNCRIIQKTVGTYVRRSQVSRPAITY